ncbi:MULTISPECIES: hypothetical protein [Asticcacaulis]|uniref:Uncharacterized protein n=1 Tax=Asticcacaulis endophyticus TaxID=1395890 RepID=A0A918UQG6_9CAUL|nr:MULTISPECIES: hypothetical protein [Asticcacaulis]WKL58761.1 hypothetical protein Q1W73_07180 [Asticcacaulis sp. ZE23SCel15]GGZ27186.1 hypothetical protein GCM10011273_11030 [Asticcacaulis endophyticus]
MSFLSRLYMPKKLMIAAWVMVATLSLAMMAQYFWAVDTIRYVMTVVYYLLLDYAWANIRREWQRLED